jgi:hypothetical protein
VLATEIFIGFLNIVLGSIKEYNLEISDIFLMIQIPKIG